MPVIIFLLMNSLVFASAWLLQRCLKAVGAVDRLLALSVFFYSQIIISQLALGLVKRLYLRELLLFNLIIFLGAYFLTHNKHGSFSLVALNEALSRLLVSRTLLLGISLLAGFALAKLAINLVNPPFGWDCLNYHFSFPVEWLKKGQLSIATTIADDPSPPYYPLNGSLIFLWLILPFKNVFMADFGQVPFFLLAFLAVYNCCRKLGLRQELSFSAALLFLITPNVFKQLEIAYVDVMLVALFLTAVNFALELYRDYSFTYLILFSLCFGLFLGVKTSAVIYGVFLVILLVAALLNNRAKLGIFSFLGSIFLCLLVAAALGGFSYFRNFLLTGNPLFPAEIKILGRVIFKGVMPLATYRDKWGIEDYNLAKLFFHEGLGLQFLLLAAPAAIFGLPVYLLKKIAKKDFLSIYILALPLLLYGAFYYFLPQLWVRYLYPFLGMGYIAGFYLLDRLKVPAKLLRAAEMRNTSGTALPTSNDRLRCNIFELPLVIRAALIICFLASAFELGSHWELVSALILSAGCFIFLPVALRLFKLNKLSALFITLVAVVILSYFNKDYERNEFNRYYRNSPFPQEEREAWQWLNAHTCADKIAYAGSPDTLPLYGQDFKNEVVYVSVNKTHPVKLHYFPGARYVWQGNFRDLHANLQEPGNYREYPDRAAWLANLKAEKVDYLVVYAFHQVREPVFGLEDSWAKAEPAAFQPVFTNQRVHIYKLNTKAINVIVS